MGFKEIISFSKVEKILQMFKNWENFIEKTRKYFMPNNRQLPS